MDIFNKNKNLQREVTSHAQNNFNVLNTTDINY